MTNLKLERYRLEQLRALEKEAKDPLAARLVHEIASELEAKLELAEQPKGKARSDKNAD